MESTNNTSSAPGELLTVGYPPLVAPCVTKIDLGVLSFIILLMIFFLKDLVPVWFRFLLLCLFSSILGFLLYFSTQKIPEELIIKVLLTVIFIFIGFTILGFILASIGIDLSWMGIYLLYALLGLIIFGIINIIIRLNNKDKKTNDNIMNFYLIIGIILFCILLIYDTNIMLQKNYMEDFITASIELYLDFINIFQKLLLFEDVN